MPLPNPILPPSAIRAIDDIRSRKRRDTCRIQSLVSGGTDRGGARRQTWGSLADAVSCRVTLPSRVPQVGVSGGRTAPEADVEIRLPRDVVIERGRHRIFHVEGQQTYDVVNDPGRVTNGFELVVMGKDSNG